VKLVAKQAFVAVLVLGFGTLLLAASRLPEACPFELIPAQKVEIATPFGSADLQVDGRGYRVGGSGAMLDYMPRVDSGPLARLGPQPHPMGTTMSISALTRGDLENVAFTCVRATRGAEVWARRPSNYDIQSPQWDAPGESWRMAAANGGPEWPAGDPVALEISVVIRGHRFVLAYPPVALLKGG
jgi:hypothetical protein